VRREELPAPAGAPLQDGRGGSADMPVRTPGVRFEADAESGKELPAPARAPLQEGRGGSADTPVRVRSARSRQT
jgi:hypothetical protein